MRRQPDVAPMADHLARRFQRREVERLSTAHWPTAPECPDCGSDNVFLSNDDASEGCEPTGHVFLTCRDCPFDGAIS